MAGMLIGAPGLAQRGARWQGQQSHPRLRWKGFLLAIPISGGPLGFVTNKVFEALSIRARHTLLGWPCWPGYAGPGGVFRACASVSGVGATPAGTGSGARAAQAWAGAIRAASTSAM